MLFRSVDYTSIIDTYRVVQKKYKYSVSYSTRIIVSITYTEEWAGLVHKSMFHTIRIVVRLTSTIDRYGIAHLKCKSSA